MTIVLCLDDKSGMLFNKRRQSRDSRIISDIAEFAQGRKILVREYSYSLFSKIKCNVSVDADYINNAEKDEICFIEDQVPQEIIDNADKIIIYRWNRVYPADVWFKNDLSGYRLESSKEFAGSSHECITREVYVR